MLPSTARSTIVMVCPTAPNNMSGRRPTLSMSAMAMSDARKYSVPLAAAMMRAFTSSMPSRSNSNVWSIQHNVPLVAVSRQCRRDRRTA